MIYFWKKSASKNLYDLMRFIQHFLIAGKVTFDIFEHLNKKI